MGEVGRRGMCAVGRRERVRGAVLPRLALSGLPLAVIVVLLLLDKRGWQDVLMTERVLAPPRRGASCGAHPIGPEGQRVSARAVVGRGTHMAVGFGWLAVDVPLCTGSEVGLSRETVGSWDEAFWAWCTPQSDGMRGSKVLARCGA